MDTEKEIIRTVYHKDVTDFFKGLGLQDKLVQGKILCAVCGQAITLENFKAVTNIKGNLKFCCAQETCIEAFSSCINEGKG